MHLDDADVCTLNRGLIERGLRTVHGRKQSSPLNYMRAFVQRGTQGIKGRVAMRRGPALSKRTKGEEVCDGGSAATVDTVRYPVNPELRL
jgi:hypothetical protein